MQGRDALPAVFAVADDVVSIPFRRPISSQSQVLRVNTLMDAVYVPVRMNMLSLYMAGYAYPAEGYPGILPRVRGSEASQFFRFDL